MCLVYDHLDTLISCGIPVCDAFEHNGVWYRSRLLIPKEPSIISVSSRTVKEVRIAKSFVTVDFVQPSNTKSHHKMSY